MRRMRDDWREPRDWRLWREPAGFFLPNCACCAAVYPPITTCAQCPTAPAQWSMTVAGITNGFCTNCARWNGSWTLTNHTITGRAGGACYWSTPAEAGAAPCLFAASNSPRWQLLLTATQAELTVDGGGGGSWTLAIGSFNCTGTNVLSKVSADTDCNNWPATITIDPI